MGKGKQIFTDTLVEIWSRPQLGMILLIAVCLAATVEIYLLSGCAVVWAVCLVGSFFYVRWKKTTRAVLRNQIFLCGSFLCPMFIRSVFIPGSICPIEYFGMTLSLVAMCTLIIAEVFMIPTFAGKKSNPSSIVAKMAAFAYIATLFALAVSMPAMYYLQDILDEAIALFVLGVFCLAALLVSSKVCWEYCGIDIKRRIRMDVSYFKAATAISFLFDVGFAFVALVTLGMALLEHGSQTAAVVDFNFRLLLCVLFLLAFCLPFKAALFFDQLIARGGRDSENFEQ